MPEFPSLAWMQAYAATVAQHPAADELARSLGGTFRFVVRPGGPVDREHAYDLHVDPDAGFSASEVGQADPTGSGADPLLVVTADHPRWQALLTGKADFVMSFLMRKVKVQGDLGAVRSRLSDARPLLDCLERVPTTFP